VLFPMIKRRRYGRKSVDVRHECGSDAAGDICAPGMLRPLPDDYRIEALWVWG
jgi:hypothetical protein